MTRILFTTIIILFSTGLFSSETTDQGVSGYSIEEARTDSIFYIYTDEEFKKAVFQIIQKNSLTNPKLFLKTLNEVKQGKIEKKEREYGIEQVSKEYSEGLNGWTITLSGMLVVFVGLILISMVIHIFNFFFRDKKSPEPVSAVKVLSEVAPSVEKAEIPEDHLVAIATAVELYKRLYLTNSMTSLTFKQNERSVWKSVNKFGLR